MATKKDRPASKNAFFTFAFIPYLQWVACFIMNGHVRRRRYLIMGFANIAIMVFLAFLPVFGDAYLDEHRMSYPKPPSESDYWGKSYDDFREGEYNQVNWEAYDKAYAEWRKSPEYKKYMAAYEAYRESDEYKRVQDNNERAYRVYGLMNSIYVISGILLYIIYVILIFFIERYRYLDALNNKGNYNTNEVINMLKNDEKKNTRKAPVKKKTEEITNKNNISYEDIITHHNKEASDVLPDVIDGILNVNLATEAQLEALPLINILDAKKIISYREAHGQYKDIDEFFASFGAKPHVIVKLQDKVTVEQMIYNKTRSVDTPKKRFDL